MKNKKNILICPLEWGLGHAGRMIALAEKLSDLNHNIIFGAGENLLAFLRNEIPGHTYIRFPGFRPGYSRFLPQYIVLLLKIPVLFYHIIAEHLRLKKIITEHSVDIVISDNRFGLWNKNIRTIYITHQPLIPFPRLLSSFEFIGVRLHRQIIRKYTLCLIPDLPGEINLTGRLTHGIELPENVRFIGILSRFAEFPEYGSPESFDVKSRQTGHIAVILSGPEPQRGILEKKVTGLLMNTGHRAIILGGKPHEKLSVRSSGNIIYHSHLNRHAMKNIITGSESVITRPGYTTIMELVSLNCSALLIPTPGQTEQEYLARYLSGKGWFKAVPQNKLNEELILTGNMARWSKKIITESRRLLDNAIREISEQSEAEA
ncbi:MAG TPA: hypothetical protein DDW27_04060 [Bacteroidales bacterium]|nr:hypothetical protein [Bacteroidales bacterium]